MSRVIQRYYAKILTASPPPPPAIKKIKQLVPAVRSFLIPHLGESILAWPAHQPLGYVRDCQSQRMLLFPRGGGGSGDHWVAAASLFVLLPVDAHLVPYCQQPCEITQKGVCVSLCVHPVLLGVSELPVKGKEQLQGFFCFVLFMYSCLTGCSTILLP